MKEKDTEFKRLKKLQIYKYPQFFQEGTNKSTKMRFCSRF